MVMGACTAFAQGEYNHGDFGNMDHGDLRTIDLDKQERSRFC